MEPYSFCCYKESVQNYVVIKRKLFYGEILPTKHNLKMNDAVFYARLLSHKHKSVTFQGNIWSSKDHRLISSSHRIYKVSYQKEVGPIMTTETMSSVAFIWHAICATAR